jgi:hypothetical protein
VERPPRRGRGGAETLDPRGWLRAHMNNEKESIPGSHGHNWLSYPNSGLAVEVSLLSMGWEEDKVKSWLDGVFYPGTKKRLELMSIPLGSFLVCWKYLLRPRYLSFYYLPPATYYSS